MNTEQSPPRSRLSPARGCALAFEREYLCEWPADTDKVLHDLAAQYHWQTEAYDRLVCTGPMGRDGILPADGYESGLINRNAHEIRKVLEAEAAKHGYTPAQLHRAIVAHNDKVSGGCPPSPTERTPNVP
jgi:hypothetical protein